MYFEYHDKMTTPQTSFTRSIIHFFFLFEVPKYDLKITLLGYLPHWSDSLVHSPWDALHSPPKITIVGKFKI